jgi:hypothetical protein
MEYMTMGSLSDLLLNESYPLEADTLLLMLKDIVQGNAPLSVTAKVMLL